LVALSPNSSPTSAGVHPSTSRSTTTWRRTGGELGDRRQEPRPRPPTNPAGRITSHQVAESLFNQGLIVNAAPDGPSQADPEIRGLRAAGIVVNCPPMFVAPA